MSEKVHKKFRKLTKQLWQTQFEDAINKMNFKKRLYFAWRIIRGDFKDATHTKI